MGYGLGIFLLAVGLILALAVTDQLANVDLTMVGWILFAAGALVVVLTAATAASRRRSTAVTTVLRRQPRRPGAQRPAAGRLS